MNTDPHFNDLIQALKTLPSKEGAQLVSLYRSAVAKARPSDWDDFWFGGAHGPLTFSGTQVDEKSALKFAPVYAAVSRISESIASLPLNLYRISGRKKEKATDHPLYRILHTQPNPEMTAIQYREASQCHLLLWGNHYSQIQRENGWFGNIKALWPLDPSRMTPKRVNDMLIYEYRVTDSGERVTFPSWEILHIAGFGFNGLVGFAPITLMRESIGLGMAQEEFAARFYSNGATFSGVLETDGTLGEDALRDLRKWFRETYGGITKAHEVAVFQQGLKFHPLTIPQKDAQFLEGRNFSVRDVARWFGIQPSMIADLADEKWNNEQQTIQFVVYTLRPRLVRTEQAMECRFDLGDRYEIRHVVEGLLRGDAQSRAEFYDKMVMNGTMTRNQVRELEDWNPIDGLDEPLEPNSNAVPAANKNFKSDGNGKDKSLDREAFRMMVKKFSAQEKKEFAEILRGTNA